MKMERVTYLLTLVLICSCSTELEEKNAQEAILSYYSELSGVTGGGTYNISEVEILKSEKLNNATWRVKAHIVGNHINMSLPEGRGPFKVDQEDIYSLRREAGKWKVMSTE